MADAVQELHAKAILAREKRRAHARAVLNRPASSLPIMIVTAVLVGVGAWLQAADRFEAPTWVVVLLISGFIGAVVNAMDAWTTRRRLEAAITLLALQENADRKA
jgi:F0F1-type ATP synthase assembly protein I